MIAQISDPHVRLGPDDLGSADALARAVDAVLRLEPLPEAVLLSGDLAEGGTPQEYARVAELLAPLTMPVHAIPGNHDTDAFPYEPRWTTEVDGLRLVGCDTRIPGREDGRLELDWLAAQLAEAPGTPTLVAMHHPPLVTGLAYLDAVRLADADRRGLEDLLRGHPQVRRVAAGHVHRVMTAVVGGCGVITCASTHLALSPRLGSPGFEIVAEPPSLLVHHALTGGLVTHVQPI